MSERQATRAWFISEEAYWLDNRAYLAWAEEEERRRDREEAERVAAEDKELEQARAIVARSDELRRLGDALAIVADKALARARGRLGSALQDFGGLATSLLKRVRSSLTALNETHVRLDDAHLRVQAEAGKQASAAEQSAGKADHPAAKYEPSTEGGNPGDAQQSYDLSGHDKDALAQALVNHLDEAAVLEKMPVRRGPGGWYLETNVLSPYYQAVAAAIGDHDLLRWKIKEDMAPRYVGAVSRWLWGDVPVLRKTAKGMQIIPGTKMPLRTQTHLVQLLKYDGNFRAITEAAISRWTAPKAASPVKSNASAKAATVTTQQVQHQAPGVSQPGPSISTWHRGRGGNGR